MKTPEQFQFQGSAQVKGFEPLNFGSAVPAYQQYGEQQSVALRKAQQLEAANLDAVGRYNVARAGQDLKSLAQFSSTLSDVLVKEAEKQNEREMQEGLSMAYMDGIDPAEQLAFDITEDHLRNTDDQVQHYGDVVQASGADFFGVQKIRELSGWKAYGYAQGIASQAPSAYANFLAQVDSEIDPNLPIAEKAAILAQKRQQFFSQTGMLGINPALLNKYAFPGMREADSVQLNRWRTAEKTRIQDSYIGEAQELISAEPVANLQKGIDLLVRSGKYNRTTARDAVFKMANDVDTFDAMADQISWDGKTTWRDKYSLQMATLRRELIRKEDSAYQTDQLERATEGKQWAEQVIEEWKANPPSAEVLEETKQFMDDTFGYIDPRLERWTQRTTDASNKEYYTGYFDRADRNGTLTVDQLNDPAVPSSVRDRFMPKAQALEKARSEAGNLKMYEKELEEQLKKIASQNSLEPGAPGLEFAKARAKGDFNREFNKAIQGGASATQAADAAFRQVSDDIKRGQQGDGPYVYHHENGFTELQPQGAVGNWTTHKVGISKLLKENKAAALDRNALIPKSILEDAAANATSTTYQPPAIAQYISDTLGGTVSPWDVLIRQGQAQGIPIETGQRFQQVTQGISPNMQRLLNYRPSYNRVARAYSSVGTFDPARVPNGYGSVVQQAAATYGVDPAILAGLIETESNYTNHKLPNSAGAVGIAQIVPKWHPTVDPTDSIASINYAAKYLSELSQQLGSIDEAIYAYNGGTGGIRKSAENRAYYPKVMKAAAKYGYNPTGNPWANPSILNPRLAYITGNIGPTSTGPHLDVKRSDGMHFKATDLDKYVEVQDPEYGRVPLSRVGTSDGQKEHRARGSHGIDYLTASGSKVYLKGGAKLLSSVKTKHGDKVTVRLPNGVKYTFLHGRRA